MMRWKHAVVATVLVGLSASATQAGSTDKLVAAVKQREAKRQSAMIAVDVAALEDIFAADVYYIHSNGLAQTKTGIIAMLTKKELRYVAFNVKESAYRTYGETVIVNGVQEISLTSSGRPFTSSSRYTVVYAMIDGEPKVVSYQSTSMPDIVMEQMQKGE